MIKVNPSLFQDQAGVRLGTDAISPTFLVQIWSMKKNEDAAAKKKPKTSAAQIRVQKGSLFVSAGYD